MEQQKEISPIIRKSNELISSKYKQSGLEGQIMAISLSRLRLESGEPRADIYAADIKKLLGKDDTNIYKKLKSVASSMVGHQIIIEDGNGNFSAFALITNADYINSVFSITFNKRLTPHILNLQKNYTSYALSNILKLKNPFSQRIYEILKKDAYHITKQNPVIKVSYSLAELRCIIGAVNMDERAVQVAKSKGASWEEIVSLAKEQSFPRWDSFKSRVLDRAKKDFMETDIDFDYEYLRSGKDRRVHTVIFFVSKREDFPVELEKYIGHNNLTITELKMLLDIAGNKDKLEDAIKYADEKPYIKNYVGFLRTCLTNGYKDTQVMGGSNKDAERMNDILGEYEKSKENPNSLLYKSMWEKIKKRDDFRALIDVPTEYLEEIYNNKELVEMFFNKI